MTSEQRVEALEMKTAQLGESHNSLSDEQLHTDSAFVNDEKKAAQHKTAKYKGTMLIGVN